MMLFSRRKRAGIVDLFRAAEAEFQKSARERPLLPDVTVEYRDHGTMFGVPALFYPNGWPRVVTAGNIGPPYLGVLESEVEPARFRWLWSTQYHPDSLKGRYEQEYRP